MEDVGKFYSHLVYFAAIWYIFGHLVHCVVFWYIFPVLVCCSKKNLATLVPVTHVTLCDLCVFRPISPV
jgi:hypothetical protein